LTILEVMKILFATFIVLSSCRFNDTGTEFNRNKAEMETNKRKIDSLKTLGKQDAIDSLTRVNDSLQKRQVWILKP
jgi:hypothetical protein